MHCNDIKHRVNSKRENFHKGWEVYGKNEKTDMDTDITVFDRTCRVIHIYDALNRKKE